MLQVSYRYAGCPGLSPVISAQSIVEIGLCVVAWNREKLLKPAFWISRSFKVIENFVSSANYDKQQVSVYRRPSYAKLVIVAKIAQGFHFVSL